MHIENDFEILGRELYETLVAQDAGVVDDDIDLAESVDGGLDDVLTAFGRGHRVVVGHGLATCIDYLLDGLVGHRGTGSGSVGRTAQVVDDNAGTTAAHHHRVCLAQAAACTCNHGHTAIVTNLAHLLTS